MKRFFLLLTLLSGSILNTWCAAQSYHTRSITAEDGLSHGYITSFWQDSRGFVWIGTFYGLNRYDGYSIKTYLPNLIDPWSLHATTIASIAEDKYGLLWLGTDKGIAILNPYTEKFVLLSDINPKAPTGFVRDIFVDEDQNIWCNSTLDGANVIYSVHSNKALVSYLGSTVEAPPSLLIRHPIYPEGFNHSVRLFLRTTPGTCLIANADGFFKLDLATRTITKTKRPTSTLIQGFSRSCLLFPDHDFGDPVAIHERTMILPSSVDHITLGTSYVFRFFDKNIYSLAKSKKLSTADDIPQLPVLATLDQPPSFARMVDCNGNLWIGTTGSGIRVLEPTPAVVDYLYPDISFSNPSIMPDDRLWAGMYDPEKMIHLSTAEVSSPLWAGYIPPEETVNAALYDSSSQNIYLVLSHRDQYLRFARFDLRHKQFHALKRLDLFNPAPTALYRDSRGNIWFAGTGGEVLRYHPTSQSIEHWNLSYLIPSKEKHRREIFRGIAEDRKGRIWIAGDAGLVMINFAGSKTQFRAFHNNGPNGPIFKTSFIFSLYPDPNDADLLWLGTLSDGFAKFDVSTGKIQYVSALSNQQFNIVSGIIPDESGNLWLTTEKGIIYYLIADNVFVNYSILKHIPKLIFNAAASLKTVSGTILFGSNNGLIRVDPGKIPAPSGSGQLFLSNATINRQPMVLGVIDNKVQLDANNQYFLQLAHDDQFISLEFSVPAAVNAASVQYRYKLEGLHKDWINLGHDRSIEFTELSPGSYTLEMQAIEPFETWTNAIKLRVPLKISPPWYSSTLARIFYILLLIIAVWGIVQYQQKKMSLQFEANLSQQEMKRLQSMDDFKNRFFAYIAHEFKTPLAIIMGTGYKLRTLHPPSSAAYPDAIIREGNNMLYLINELIDVTRLQDKSIQPNYEHRDLVGLLRKIISSYQPILEFNQVNLRFNCAQPTHFMDLDPLRTQYILNNILSNAIQYTPPDGHIIISVQTLPQERVIVSVADSGQGIPPDKLPHIFDKYYRAFDEDNAYHNFGLGLSFVKELAELLRAEISVESTLGEGTVFSLILPDKAPSGSYVKEVDESEDEINRRDIFVSTRKADANAPSLLIVDDHPTIQSYLKSILQPHFQLTVAKNGQEGFTLATEEIPDLILTDVMMPLMDGIEMTAKLKGHPLTSHIPIVMLSAKNEVQDRLKGQYQGADVYMGKPFHEQELVVTLHNLFKLQQQWKTRYSAAMSGTPYPDKFNDLPDSFSPDSIAHNDLFVQQILDAFEANYASVHFDALELAATLKISKAQLYRKVSKISEEGAMSMLRNFRLNKAVELLDKYPQMSTKQVAYKVGFKEYSHFSSSFKKLFQVSPSEWRKLKKQAPN